jgi:hypothetical protein
MRYSIAQAVALTTSLEGAYLGGSLLRLADWDGCQIIQSEPEKVARDMTLWEKSRASHKHKCHWKSMACNTFITFWEFT